MVSLRGQIGSNHAQIGLPWGINSNLLPSIDPQPFYPTKKLHCPQASLLRYAWCAWSCGNVSSRPALFVCGPRRWRPKRLEIILLTSDCICCGSILSLVQFLFPLFLCLVMYDNEYKTKENKIEPIRIQLNHNI